jgi:tetratricopeptide (TPR) repeat protein
MNKLQKLEQIELYLEGKLAGHELEEFEEELRTDQDLLNELENYKKAVEGIRILSRNQMKTKLKSIHHEVIGSNVRIANPSFKLIKIAAVIIGVLILTLPSLYFFMHSQKTKTERLFEENFSPYINITTQRGEIMSKDEMLQNTAMYYYNNREFDKALVNFDELIKTQVNPDPTLWFYYAITCLAAAQDEKAIRIFTKLTSDKNYLLFEQSQWYLALSYMKAKDKQKAIGVLKKISSQNGHYSIKAENLLTELK